MSDITLRQIRYFAVLSKTLQYRRAAQRLGISQPSLTLQINALESALGARLVERRRSGLILTPAGREAAAQAEKLLRELEMFKQAASPVQANLGGTLRLGTSQTIGPYVLPRILRQLHLTYPDLKLVIRDGPPRELSEELLTGRHDMILTQLPVSGDDVRVQDLYREPLNLAVALDHRLAGAHRVQHADLDEESMLSLSPAYALHRQVSSLCQMSGAVLRDDFEGTSLDALRQMVSLGMGITLLPSLYIQSEVRQADADVAIVPLHPQLYRQVGLVWRAASGNPPAFIKIGAFIRQIVAQEFAGNVILSG